MMRLWRVFLPTSVLVFRISWKAFRGAELEDWLTASEREGWCGGALYCNTVIFRQPEIFCICRCLSQERHRCSDYSGIKPITTLKHIQFLPKTFYIDLPEALADELEKCKTSEQAMQVGIEWSIQQVKELISHGVPCIHFYTMGKSDAVRRIVKAAYWVLMCFKPVKSGSYFHFYGDCSFNCAFH